jgi:protein tyrosine/serine phosphatase
MALALVLSPADLPGDVHIPRFAEVAGGIYRGGQPTRAGFEFLKSRGIRTVINLRLENDEADIVTELGMTYVHIPVSIGPWSRIPESAIQRFFEVLGNPDNFPVFVHCRRGADRTGAMVAFYRTAVQGWTGALAYSEARKIGMRWWYPAVKTQIKAFAASLQASRYSPLAAASPSGQP